jgi:penicillin-binding protein 2
MILAVRLRLILVAVIMTGGFVVLLHRLWTLQIEKQDQFILKLPETQKSRQRVPGTRGRILDSGGTELARNETCLEVGLNLAAAEAAWLEREKAKPKSQRRSIPKYVYDPKKEPATDIIAILNEIVFPELNRIGLYVMPSPREVRKIYEWYLTYKGVVPYPYVRNLLQADPAKFELIAAYAENAPSIPGIIIQERPKRRYPLRAAGAHFIGYLRETRTEKPPESEGSWDFFQSDDVGLAGIEKTQNELLRGKPGERVWLRNEHGRLTEEIESLRRDPLPGSDVYLTIDSRIQMAVETAFRQAGVGRGASVVMNVHTGEVLAMVSVPSYDPNIFIPPQDTESINAIYRTAAEPSINRAVAADTPGSTFKILTAMAASTTGHASRYYHCSGSVNYGAPFNCWTVQKRIGGHGSLPLSDAIRSSCNCYFYLQGNATGIESIASMARLFTFGSSTGIQLDTERNGFMPTPEWWTARRNEPWNKGKTAHVSIGQGEVTATPLQVCMLAATVATGGKCWQPTIISHTRSFEYDSNGHKQERITRFEPKLKFDLTEHGVRKADLKAMSDGMYKAVNAKRGGTGTAAKSKVGISAKTGTAQKKRREMVYDEEKGRLTATGPLLKDNRAWFMSFAPSENPQIAVSVVVANGEAGGKVAGPIARRIIEQSLAILAGNLRMEVGPLPPAEGHFNKLEKVSFPDDIPEESPPEEEPTADDAGEEAADVATDSRSPDAPGTARPDVAEEGSTEATPSVRLRRARFARRTETQNPVPAPPPGVITNP